MDSNASSARRRSNPIHVVASVVMLRKPVLIAWIGLFSRCSTIGLSAGDLNNMIFTLIQMAHRDGLESEI
jgi:hypothetical protein